MPNHNAHIITQINAPCQRLTSIAERLIRLRPSRSAPDASLGTRPITVVCISDTHNLRPDIPPGDILIHAGDLSQHGTFDEIQAQLSWLSSQPHKHKLVIAGNHDSLLDSNFLATNPEKKKDEDPRTKADLDFGSLLYLQEESVTLDFADRNRQLKVYGSPWTPQYGTFAFQYLPIRDRWKGNVPLDTKILVTHGPPARFRGIKPSAGCSHLRREIGRVKPKLVVFGHIHFARGEETVVFDAAQRAYDDIQEGLRGWDGILFLCAAVVWSRIQVLLGKQTHATRLIDAAVVDDANKEKALPAFVVEI